jgi:metal-sulfur cluster biosynthetic enzyme
MLWIKHDKSWISASGVARALQKTVPEGRATMVLAGGGVGWKRGLAALQSGDCKDRTRGERVLTEERVRDQLRNVIDPEIGMDLVELGLIYDVGVHDEGRHVDVTFSLTSPMCPVGDMIQEQVETETLAIEGVETVNSQLTFDPMWNPEMMSPAAKLFFGR